MGEFGSDPDSSLVAAACAGDREAFRSLLERHYDRIHDLALRDHLQRLPRLAAEAEHLRGVQLEAGRARRSGRRAGRTRRL